MKRFLLLSVLVMPFMASSKKVDLPISVEFELPPGDYGLGSDSFLVQIEQLNEFNNGNPIKIPSALYFGEVKYHRSASIDSKIFLDASADKHKLVVDSEHKSSALAEKDLHAKVEFLEHAPMVVAITLPYQFDDKEMKVRYRLGADPFIEPAEDDHIVIALKSASGSNVKFKLKSYCYGIDWVALGQKMKLIGCDSANVSNDNIGKYSHDMWNEMRGVGGVIIDSDGRYVQDPLSDFGGTPEEEKAKKKYNKIARTAFLEYYITPFVDAAGKLSDDVVRNPAGGGPSPDRSDVKYVAGVAGDTEFEKDMDKYKKELANWGAGQYQQSFNFMYMMG